MLRHDQMIEELFATARLAIACGPDGEGMQLIALSASREEAWQKLVSGAAILRRGIDGGQPRRLVAVGARWGKRLVKL
jgi:hypothetical protein